MRERFYDQEARVTPPTMAQSSTGSRKFIEHVKEFARAGGAGAHVATLEAMEVQCGIRIFAHGLCAPGLSPPADARVVDIWHFQPFTVKDNSLEPSPTLRTINNPCIHLSFCSVARLLVAHDIITVEEQTRLLAASVMVETNPLQMDSNAASKAKTPAALAKAAGVKLEDYTIIQSAWTAVIAAWLREKYNRMDESLMICTNGTPAKVRVSVLCNSPPHGNVLTVFAGAEMAGKVRPMLAGTQDSRAQAGRPDKSSHFGRTPGV